MPPAWLSTEDAARELGCVSARWVRSQIEDGRLDALVLATGRRPTYRIARHDWDRFVSTYVLRSSERNR